MTVKNQGQVVPLTVDADPEDDVRIERLLGESSLGTPGARRLRDRSSRNARDRTRESAFPGSQIRPHSYADARQIGEALRAGGPVLVDLSEISDDEAKRLIDFMAGVAFGLQGRIERVAAKVFVVRTTV